MQLGLPHGGQPVGDRAANELVGEPVRDGGAELLDEQAAPDPLVECFDQSLGRDDLRPAERLEVELRACDRGELEHGPRLGRVPCQPVADDLAHGRRRAQLRGRPHEARAARARLDRARFDELAPELGDEEGIATGQLADRPAQLGGRVAPCGEAEELADLVVREATEPDPDDAFGAGDVDECVTERGRDLARRVTVRGDDQHPRPGSGAHEVAQQMQRRRVRPVEVLEYEQDRHLEADCREHVGDRCVETMALCVDVRRLTVDGAATVRLQAGQEQAELGLPAGERLLQLGRLEPLDELPERVRERPVRSADDVVAVAVEDERILSGDLVGELSHEAALPGAGLARDERGAPPLTRRARQEGTQRLELARPAGERIRRRETQRSG